MFSVTYTNACDEFQLEFIHLGPDRREALLRINGKQERIRLSSGIPGVVGGADSLSFSKSRTFVISYGTGVIGRFGDNGYGCKHDSSKRGQVIKLVETDASGLTEIYIDVAERIAHFGQSWIIDFKPLSGHDLCPNWNSSLKFCPDCGKQN